jgi:hypothetical protein
MNSCFNNGLEVSILDGMFRSGDKAAYTTQATQVAASIAVFATNTKK